MFVKYNKTLNEGINTFPQGSTQFGKEGTQYKSKISLMEKLH